MKRLVDVVELENGELTPDIGLWCAVCNNSIWAVGWESDLCPWCENTITDAQFQHTADVTGFKLRRYTHTLRVVYPRDLRREL